MPHSSKAKLSSDELDEVLKNGDEKQLADIAAHLISAADTDPGFANIAADWLHYGRYGVEEDRNRAAKFRAKAIEALIPDAIYDHAMLLEAGEKDGARTALPYYILASVLGDADAISALSEYFLYGEEFEINYFLAGALKKHENLLRRENSESQE